MFLVVEMLGSRDHFEHATILAGTKRCLTEPFRVLLGIPEERIRIAPNRDETLTISNDDRSIKLHVTTNKFDDAEDIFSRNDRELFPNIEQTTRSND